MKKIVLALSLVMALSLVSVASAATPTIAELQAQIAALTAQLATLSGSTPAAAGSVPTITKNLSLGSKGDEVSDLQQYLIDEGLLDVAAPTGYFGTMTKKAVIEWQKANDVSPASGLFGPISRATLAALAKAPGTTPGTTPVVGLSDQKDGSLTVSASSVVSNSQSLKKGDVNKGIIAAHVVASVGDVNVNRFDVDFNYRPWQYFTNLVLKDSSGNVIATKSLSRDSVTEVTIGSLWMARFDNVNYVVKAGQAADLIVYADVSSNSDKITSTATSITVTVPSSGIRTINGKGYTDTPSVPAALATTGYAVSLSSTGSTGDLNARIDTGSPLTQSISVSTTNTTPDVVLGVFDIKTVNQAGNINTLVFNINNNKGYTGTTLMQNVRLYDGGTQIAGGSMTAASPSVVTFSNMSIPLSADTWKALTLKADVLATSSSFSASSTLDVSGTVGTDSNDNTITLTNAADVTSSDTNFVPSGGLTVTNTSATLGSAVVQNNYTVGYNATYKFTLNNSGNNNIWVASDRGVLVGTSSAASSGGSTISSTTMNLLTVDPSTVAGDSASGATGYYVIPAGQARTFTLNARLSPVAGGAAQTTNFLVNKIYYWTSTTGTAPASVANLQNNYIDYGLSALNLSSSF